MQPNQMSNQPTPAPSGASNPDLVKALEETPATESTAPKQAESNTDPKPKSSKLPWTCAIIAIILALAGIGFGIYGMTKPSNTSNIEKAEAGTQDTNNTITPPKSKEDEEVENNSEEKNKTETTYPSPTLNDDSTIYSDIEIDGEEVYIQTVAVHYSKDGKEEKKMYVYASNGKLYCDIGAINYSESRIEKCNLDVHQGKVVDIADGLMGNGGGLSMVLILNEEGEIEYIQGEGENAGVLKKLALPKKVIQIYGDKKIHSMAYNEGSVVSSGFTVLVKYEDGSIEDLYYYFNPET